jgi:hypothetical protein
MYHLGELPPDPALAVSAWVYLLDAAGTAAVSLGPKRG